jgi:tRNA U34 2-thiouridine synthase MnmA/TrmU
MDARAVCSKLGIPYYLIAEAAEFHNKVIRYFADEYKAGRPPDADAAPRRRSEGEAAHATTRHHRRLGGGVLSGSSRPGRRVECAALTALG